MKSILKKSDYAEIRKKIMPFSGNLNREEWARLIYKHLDHHLKQLAARLSKSTVKSGFRGVTV